MQFCSRCQKQVEPFVEVQDIGIFVITGFKCPDCKNMLSSLMDWGKDIKKMKVKLPKIR